MPTVIFDTLQLSKDLRDHFSEDQADAIAMALARGASDRLATKDDIGEVKAAVADLRSELYATKSELKADIALLKVDTVKWIVSAIAFNFLATASLFHQLF